MGRRLTSGPPAKAHPATLPAPRLRLGPAQLARLACLRAGPLTRPASAPRRAVPARRAAPFPRAAPDRIGARSPHGRHAPAMHATRQAQPASPSTRSPSSADPAALPPSLSRAASLLRRTELCSRAVFATAAPPAKFAAGAPPLPAIKRA